MRNKETVTMTIKLKGSGQAKNMYLLHSVTSTNYCRSYCACKLIFIMFVRLHCQAFPVLTHQISIYVSVYLSICLPI